MNLPLSAQKYLARQGDSKWDLIKKGDKLFDNIIVVPAHDEYKNIPNLLSSLSLNSNEYLSKTLVVIVVNNGENCGKSEIENNEMLLMYLREQININTELNLGFVDASSYGKELPEKHAGVGLARKIGLDLSLKLFNYQNETKNLLMWLDADCIVSNNYLKEIIDQFNKYDFHAAVINFEHQILGDENHEVAITNYEIFLRYYVLGLKSANSAYGYLSVGSTIVSDVESYIKVGGMNKKKAGEDFYFLEKLTKITPIKKVVGATVFPSSRTSERVPFGTGARINRFLDKSHNEYTLYSPDIFIIVKNWLELFSLLSLADDPLIYLEKAKIVSLELHSFLVAQNFLEDWINIIKSSKTELQIENQKKNWMDGFRTLKLVHHIRDNGYPNQDMFRAINELLDYCDIKFDFKTRESLPNLKTQAKYLNLLREHT